MSKRSGSITAHGMIRERFDAVVKSVVGRRLTYEELIGELGSAQRYPHS